MSPWDAQRTCEDELVDVRADRDAALRRAEEVERELQRRDERTPRPKTPAGKDAWAGPACPECGLSPADYTEEEYERELHKAEARVTELEREVGELKLRVAEAVDVSAYDACEECSIAREKAETEADELRAMLERVLETAPFFSAAAHEARALLDRTAGTEARDERD
jgi:hypothetical protein